MKLFPYQQQFTNEIRRAFKHNRRVIGRLPTGGGKGVIIADVARGAIEKGRCPCISVHRVEIFQQIFDNLIRFGLHPGLIESGNYPSGSHDCYLSMVETFNRRIQKGMTEHLGIDFLILDEIHLGNYHKIVKDSDLFILGFTATPKSTGKPELKEYFDALVCGPSEQDLMSPEIARLARAKTYSIKYDFSGVKMRGGDYDERELFKEFKKPRLYDGAVKKFLEVARDQQALCYCVNVEHSNDTMNQFRNHGIKAAHVDGKTDKETRDTIFNMYRDGDIQVICNVGIATTGTDLPDTGCIIQNFATVSLVKHIQTLGRGARVADGKNHFIVIDMGRNYIRHGEFGELVDWNYIFNYPSEATKKKDKRDKRECRECGMVIRLHLRKCPNCGDVLTPDEHEKEILYGATLEEIKEYRIKTMPVHLRKSIRDMSKDELFEYARHMGYKTSWVYVMLNKVFKK